MPGPEQYWPLWAVLVPLVGSVVAYILGVKSPRARDTFALFITVATFGLVVSMYPLLAGGKVIGVSFPSILMPFGVSFRADILSFGMAAIITLIYSLAMLYALGYMHEGPTSNRFYSCTLLTLAGCVGTVFAGDLLTLFIFFEAMSLASYVLVIHEQTPRAMQAGNLYFVTVIVGGLAIFLGLVTVYEVTGSVTFGELPILKDISLEGGMVTLMWISFVGFLVGFGMKAGIVPLHTWLPEAHPVAPSPASALLSGVMLKTGAYGLIRVIFNVFGTDMVKAAGWDNILLALAAATIVLGSVWAIMEDQIKRRLAYSSIAQMGYILLGMALLTERALIGDFFHIFSHAIMKACLFLAAGAVIHATGKERVSEINGVGLQMPVTMACFGLASLAMIGIPPFNGFISKIFLGLGALDAGMPLYLVLLLISSFMNAIYYLPIIISAFFRQLPEGTDASYSEVPVRMMAPMVVLAVATFIFVVGPANLPLILSQLMTVSLMGGS